MRNALGVRDARPRGPAMILHARAPSQALARALLSGATAAHREGFAVRTSHKWAPLGRRQLAPLHPLHHAFFGGQGILREKVAQAHFLCPRVEVELERLLLLKQNSATQGQPAPDGAAWR